MKCKSDFLLYIIQLNSIMFYITQNICDHFFICLIMKQHPKFKYVYFNVKEEKVFKCIGQLFYKSGTTFQKSESFVFFPVKHVFLHGRCRYGKKDQIRSLRIYTRRYSFFKIITLNSHIYQFFQFLFEILVYSNNILCTS